MNRIIPHRGVWRKQEEQNTLNAVFLALTNYSAVEIDIRQSPEGELGTGHDAYQPFEFWKIPTWHGALQKESYFIAFHIKEAGLAIKLQQVIKDIILSGMPLEYTIFGFHDLPNGERDAYEVFFDPKHLAAELYSFPLASEINLAWSCTSDSKVIWMADLGDKPIPDEWFEKLEASGKELIMVTPECFTKRNIKAKFCERILSLMTDLTVHGVCTDQPEFFHEYKSKFN